MTEPVERVLASQRTATHALIADLERELAGLMLATESANTDDEHDPEGATIGFERAQLSATLAQARAGLVELDAAAQRHRDGSYGHCAECRQPISPERLAARPAARTCVDCARRSNGSRR